MTDSQPDPIAEFVWKHLRQKVERSGEDVAANALPEHVAVTEAIAHPTPSDLGFTLPGGYSVRRYEVRLRCSEITVELNAADASVLGWIMPPLGEHSGQDLDEPGLLQLATQSAQPRAGAVLAEAGYEQVGGQPVYSARWVHIEQGLRVERDYVRVLINGTTGQVFAGYRHWHTVDYRATER